MSAADSATVLDTTDVDEARERLARAYCPHGLRVPGRGRGFHARQEQALDGPVGAFRLTYGADAVVVEPEAFGHFVLVSRPLAGALRVTGDGYDARAGVGEPVVLDPRHRHVLHFGGGCRLLTVKLPVAAVDRAAGGDGVADALRTDRAVDRVPWDAATRFLLREALPHGLLTPGSPMRSHTLQLLAAALVASFQPPAAPVRPADAAGALARAREFVAARAHEDIGLADIAAAAGVGTRTLQYAFRRELGTTPSAYLRRTRLELARGRLRDGAAATVAEVAISCGFGNLGRFATEYRRLFGRLPHQDLAGAPLG